ncbi:MAG: hypothetical protein O6931_06845, partial [Gammaproteobacteria bacterium]|nr:hypothetical protein [Gammaproteobacteria bacterium]
MDNDFAYLHQVIIPDENSVAFAHRLHVVSRLLEGLRRVQDKAIVASERSVHASLWLHLPAL